MTLQITGDAAADKVLSDDPFALLLGMSGATMVIGLVAALSERDFERIRRLAHNLKGASSNLGGDRLARCLHSLEQAARTEKLELAQAAMTSARLSSATRLLPFKTRDTVLGETPAMRAISSIVTGFSMKTSIS